MPDAVMRSERTDRRYAHNVLIQHINSARFDAALARADAAERFAVRSLLLRNVLSGRMTGLLHAGGVADVESWFTAYVRQVHAVYKDERADWERLLTYRAGRECDPLFDALKHAMRMSYRQLEARYKPAAHLFDSADVISDAFARLRGDRALINYPFDVTLSAWLRKQIAISARALYRACALNSPLDDGQPELVDHWMSVDRLERLSLSVAVARLLADDQRIVNDWLGGISPERTAAALGIKTKTVYLRRKRVIEQLRELLA
jgi:DNA-directed RNA polymerase specialized sigma24 family protein